MKVIGLAACHDTKNFGSQLQLLANAKKIEDLGYQVEVIRYQKKLTPVFIMQTVPRLFNLGFIRQKLRGQQKKRMIRKNAELFRKYSVRAKRFTEFAQKNFAYCPKLFAGWETLVKEANARYDGFVCGSDQLWLPNNLGSHFYTLEFVKSDKPKIAYATSFGVSEIPWFQKRSTARYLNRFQALSTREIAGSRIIEDLTGKKAQVVCDPTMLYDGEEWKQIIPSRRVVEQPYIFAYLLGDNLDHRQAAQELKEKTGLTLVTCPFADSFVPTDKDFGDIQMFDMDSADFVNLIRHAEYVLTDSFHGTVFSILNKKKFLTFTRFREGKNSRNSRIDSLCTLLELEERRYVNDVLSVQMEIDYKTVDSKLEELRKESTVYLRNALMKV